MHVLARLQGYGAIVLPKAPYRLERVPDSPTELRVHYGEQSETVDIERVLRGDQATDLADIDPGDPAERWHIETTLFRCVWPEGFALVSDPEGGPFLLLGPEDSMLWLAGPLDRGRTSPIEKLATADQTIRAVGQAGDRERIDLTYRFEGELWWQRRYVVPWPPDQAIVISAQARPAVEPLAAAAIDLLEATLAPMPRARTAPAAKLG